MPKRRPVPDGKVIASDGAADLLFHPPVSPVPSEITPRIFLPADEQARFDERLRALNIEDSNAKEPLNAPIIEMRERGKFSVIYPKSLQENKPSDRNYTDAAPLTDDDTVFPSERKPQKTLSPEEVTELVRLRTEDPVKHSVANLAWKFGITRSAVLMFTKSPKEFSRSAKKQRRELISDTGTHKGKVRIARYMRRKTWLNP